MAVLNRHKHRPGPNDVYIGRGSKWGNPFVIGIHGTRDVVCDKYEGHLDSQINAGKISTAEIAALHGKNLVCFCAPERCHGDYLARRAHEFFTQLNQENSHDQAPATADPTQQAAS